MSLQIISGGQTGVDRAALDAAIVLGIPHRGWCPRGRLAEDGAIDAKYALKETPERDYAVRTEKNVIESDGTLILYRGKMTGGTRLTFKLTQKNKRPCLAIDLESEIDDDALSQWMTQYQINNLNIAGPRESTHPGIYDQVFELLRYWLEPLQNI